METEHDYDPTQITMGDRNLIQVSVSHDLGDRTLVLVVLLTIVIGACGVVMGLNLSKQEHLDNLAREVAAKVQIQNNQNSRIEAKLEEMSNEQR